MHVPPPAPDGYSSSVLPQGCTYLLLPLMAIAHQYYPGDAHTSSYPWWLWLIGITSGIHIPPPAPDGYSSSVLPQGCTYLLLPLMAIAHQYYPGDAHTSSYPWWLWLIGITSGIHIPPPAPDGYSSSVLPQGCTYLLLPLMAIAHQYYPGDAHTSSYPWWLWLIGITSGIHIPPPAPDGYSSSVLPRGCTCLLLPLMAIAHRYYPGDAHTSSCPWWL